MKQKIENEARTGIECPSVFYSDNGNGWPLVKELKRNLNTVMPKSFYRVFTRLLLFFNCNLLFFFGNKTSY